MRFTWNIPILWHDTIPGTYRMVLDLTPVAGSFAGTFHAEWHTGVKATYEDGRVVDAPELVLDGTAQLIGNELHCATYDGGRTAIFEFTPFTMTLRAKHWPHQITLPTTWQLAAGAAVGASA